VVLGALALSASSCGFKTNSFSHQCPKSLSAPARID
jgi:hypothetical protein